MPHHRLFTTPSVNPSKASLASLLGNNANTSRAFSACMRASSRVRSTPREDEMSVRAYTSHGNIKSQRLSKCGWWEGCSPSQHRRLYRTAARSWLRVLETLQLRRVRVLLLVPDAGLQSRVFLAGLWRRKSRECHL
jgi:hypothetical protein